MVPVQMLAHNKSFNGLLYAKTVSYTYCLLFETFYKKNPQLF